MRYALMLSLLIVAMPCQAQTSQTGEAKTIGPCSPAVTGNNNQFRINCQGITKEQGTKMLNILNTILTNQLDPKAVMGKLDEILKAVVPQRVSAADMARIKEYLSQVQTKTRIQITVAQNSNAIPYANDVYKAFRLAGWTMEGEGASEVLVLWSGKKFTGVTIVSKGEPIAPNEKVSVNEGDPLFYIATVLNMLEMPRELTREPKRDADLITLQFSGLPDKN
jgi:hypothetical protein